MGDSAMDVLMYKVNKVIIGCNLITSSGGVLGDAGTLPLCLSAKDHSVPVLVVTALYKLSPLHNIPDELEHAMYNPLSMAAEEFNSNVNVYIPCYDYIDPKYIEIYITDKGAYAPFYM